MNKRVVLAYSGGLDTSCILKWLIEGGYDVFCFLANVGQDEDFDAIEKKARAGGAKDVFIVDCRREFVTNYIWPAVQSNAIYESRYLMGTSLARPCIAFEHVKIAHKVDAKYISHGATGKGNDQVRFELSVLALDPALEVIAPWRLPEFYERFQGRSDLLAYAKEHNIPISGSGAAAPYSMDANLYHISYESGILEDPDNRPHRDMFLMTNDPVTAASAVPDNITVHFHKGLPVKVEHTSTGIVDPKDPKAVKAQAKAADAPLEVVTDPLEIMLFLNRIGKKHGIGRIDIVENRFVGVKSRGVYETPGGTILREAHIDIEGIAMDREVMKIRDMLSIQFAERCYNGFWFAPEMEFIRTAIAQTQNVIDGYVNLELFRGRAYVVGRYSPFSLYNQDLSSMEISGGFNPTDSSGFIKINSIRLMAHRALVNQIQLTDPTRLTNSFVAKAVNEAEKSRKKPLSRPQSPANKKRKVIEAEDNELVTIAALQDAGD